MGDFKKDSSAANLSRFGRDRRDRSGDSDNRSDEGGRPRFQRDGSDSNRPQKFERRSYNPNFSRDNRPNGESNERGERGDRGERKPYNREGGERKSYNKPYNREGGERGERGDRGEQRERRPYDPNRKSYDPNRKPYDPNRKPYNREGGERKKSFAPRGNSNNRRSDEPKSYPKYDPNNQTGEVRLNRYLAQSGLCSRREADDFIAAGVVTVNGVVVTELGTKVMPTDEVKFNDSRVVGEKRVYLVLNKPKGYVTSNDDPHADKTVMDLVRGACMERIYPVGRLDKSSVGLLLFTNDGDLTKQLTHPSHRKKKIYQVSLNKPLTRADMSSIAEGVTLEDGEIYADEISYVKEDKSEVGVEIHSGRNRIVRRIFEHLGYSVQKLDRVYYAGLTKKNLRRGEWRFLTPAEVERLKSGRYE